MQKIANIKDLFNRVAEGSGASKEAEKKNSLLHNVITGEYKINIAGTGIGTDWEKENTIRAILMRELRLRTLSDWRRGVHPDDKEKFSQYLQNPLSAMDSGGSWNCVGYIHIVTDRDNVERIPVLNKVQSIGAEASAQRLSRYLKRMLVAWYTMAPWAIPTKAAATFIHFESDSELTVLGGSPDDVYPKFDEMIDRIVRHLVSEPTQAAA